MSQPIIVGSTLAQDFARSSRLEWLETNGTGAFAMGTVAGANTRRYHGLLVASLKPGEPRRLLLARVEEEAVVEGKQFELGTCQYPGTVAPRGFELIQEFRAEPCATWVYRLGEARLEKQVYLAEGRPAVIVRYRADRRLSLRVRPFLANRDYHWLQRASPGAAAIDTPVRFHCAAKFVQDPHWYYDVEYLEELDRGFDFREDLYTPGVYVFNLQPGEWATLCASTDGIESAPAPASKRDPFLIRCADSSPAGSRPAIIAGYPWFTDWGRDTMISLNGLLIARGKLDIAREIIEAALKTLNQGLIPNRFPDAGVEPEYNTADATLWMFEAMRAWLDAGGERDFLDDVFLPAAREMIAWHMRGTHDGIGVDPQDYLLRAGESGSNLTWMDARVDGKPVTPRHGKPVEINALWHSALRRMADWGDNECWVETFRVAQSFREAFWNDTRECLYDVVTDAGPLDKLRPNQILAVSLGDQLLGRLQQQAVVRIVERELLTPVGLRTLERSDPEYRAHYQGGPAERDAAYHQGTVWPWLLGPFVDAYLIAFGRTPQNLEYCRGLVRQLEERAAQGPCLGSIPEIYDGDEPHAPRGCPAQAWSVAEIGRLKNRLL